MTAGKFLQGSVGKVQALAAIGLLVAGVVTPARGHVGSSAPKAQAASGGAEQSYATGTDRAGGAELPAFEVASIKVDSSGGVSGGFLSPDPSHFQAINVPAKNLVTYAYSIKDLHVSGGPNWIRSIHYDIEAKVDDAELTKMKGMTRDQARDEIRLMLRSLLAERFNLRLTRSTKDEPEFALVVAKGGPKLTPTAWIAPDPDAPKSAMPPEKSPHLVIGAGQISAVDQPMSALADVLMFMPEFGGKLLIDKTGIKGNYDFTVQFSSEEMKQRIAAAAPGLPLPPTDDSAPSIFTALEEQLGLRVEPTHGPVDVYTIDHIEQPTEN